MTLAAVALPACSSPVRSEGRTTTTIDPARASVVVTTTDLPVTTIATTSTSTSTTTSTTSTTVPTSTSTSSTSTTSTTITPPTSTTSTTTTSVPLDVYDPECVVKVQPDDNLVVIAGRLADGTIDPDTIKG